MTSPSSNYLRLAPFHSLTVGARYYLLLMAEWFPQSKVLELSKAHNLITIYGDLVDSRAVFKELVDNEFAVLGKHSKSGKWLLGLVDWFDGTKFPDTFIPHTHGRVPEPFVEGGTPSAWVKHTELPKRSAITVDKEVVDAVFLVWRDLYRTPKYCIKRDERRHLTEALVAYSPEYLKKAIRGLQYSGWHTGTNPDGVRYDKIHHVIRNAETFVSLYEQAETV